MAKLSNTSLRSRTVFRFAVGAALVVAGSALLIIGWWRISGEARVAAQLPYLASSSIPGAALLMAGAAFLAGRNRGAPDPRVDALLALLTEPVAPGSTRTSGRSDASIAQDPDTFVVADGASHYHRPDCALVAGKPVKPYEARAGASEASGHHAACPLCTQSP